MIVQRDIGCVSLEVDTFEANEVYFNPRDVVHIVEPGINGILDAIYTINSREHMPISAFFELTSRCNFSCPFCYINEEGYLHSQLPGFAELKPLFDYLIDNGLLYCVLSGGECLMHSDFSKIYRYLKEKGVLVTVFTNGYLLNQKLYDLFSTYKPFKVEISLYGSDDSSYSVATDTEGIVSDIIFRNVLKLKQLGVNVICKTPITSITENHYKAIEIWCEENQIPYYTSIELMDAYSGASRRDYFASEILREKMKKESDAAFFADPNMIRIAYGTKKRKLNFECSAGKTDIFIDAHYNLMPCMKAAWLPDWKFNIGQLGIEGAYQSLVKKIIKIKGTPLQYCDGCIHSEVCQECYMTQYEHSDLRGHRGEYCKRLREFMGEGRCRL